MPDVISFDNKIVINIDFSSSTAQNLKKKKLIIVFTPLSAKGAQKFGESLESNFCFLQNVRSHLEC